MCVYLLSVGAGVQAWHQVEDVAERHWVQVFDEWGEEVVDVTATVFQLKHQTWNRINYFIFEQKREFLTDWNTDVFVLKSAVWDLNIWINVCSNITSVSLHLMEHERANIGKTLKLCMLIFYLCEFLRRVRSKIITTFLHFKKGLRRMLTGNIK